VCQRCGLEGHRMNMKVCPEYPSKQPRSGGGGESGAGATSHTAGRSGGPPGTGGLSTTSARGRRPAPTSAASGETSVRKEEKKAHTSGERSDPREWNAVDERSMDVSVPNGGKGNKQNDSKPPLPDLRFAEQHGSRRKRKRIRFVPNVPEDAEIITKTVAVMKNKRLRPASIVQHVLNMQRLISVFLQKPHVISSSTEPIRSGGEVKLTLKEQVLLVLGADVDAAYRYISSGVFGAPKNVLNMLRAWSYLYEHCCVIGVEEKFIGSSLGGLPSQFDTTKDKLKGLKTAMLKSCSSEAPSEAALAENHVLSDQDMAAALAKARGDFKLIVDYVKQVGSVGKRYYNLALAIAVAHCHLARPSPRAQEVAGLPKRAVNHFRPVAEAASTSGASNGGVHLRMDNYAVVPGKGAKIHHFQKTDCAILVEFHDVLRPLAHGRHDGPDSPIFLNYKGNAIVPSKLLFRFSRQYTEGVLFGTMELRGVVNVSSKAVKASGSTPGQDKEVQAPPSQGSEPPRVPRSTPAERPVVRDPLTSHVPPRPSRGDRSPSPKKRRLSHKAETLRNALPQIF